MVPSRWMSENLGKQCWIFTGQDDLGRKVFGGVINRLTGEVDEVFYAPFKFGLTVEQELPWRFFMDIDLQRKVKAEVSPLRIFGYDAEGQANLGVVVYSPEFSAWSYWTKRKLQPGEDWQKIKGDLFYFEVKEQGAGLELNFSEAKAFTEAPEQLKSEPLGKEAKVMVYGKELRWLKHTPVIKLGDGRVGIFIEKPAELTTPPLARVITPYCSFYLFSQEEIHVLDTNLRRR